MTNCSVIRKLGGNWFHCINDSHFSDGSHLHYMRELPDVYDPITQIPVNTDAVRLHPHRDQLPTVQTP